MRPLPPRLILLSILALFILPLALAWMMFTGTIPFKSQNTRNLGQLVIPTVPLDWSGATITGGTPANHSLQGFWIILYALPEPCTQKCLTLAAGLRQVHFASGQNNGRIKIALLLGPNHAESLSDKLLTIYPRFHLISEYNHDFSSALGHAGSNSSRESADSLIYLVDPLGNIMMTYNGAGSPVKLNKDLTRLLTWSKLDKRS